MKCPSCGADAKGNFCEYCGNEIPKDNNTTINITNNFYEGSTSVNQVKPKKKTWLWVLGWIFVFPLPLTILLLRKKGMKPIAKYCIIALAWLIYVLIGISGDSTTQEPAVAEPLTSQKVELTAPIATEKQEPEVISIVYAEDEVVNRFITEFNNNTEFEITDIREGNIRTKFFGYANDRYLEMINANNAGAEAFSLKINGGQEESDKLSMYDVFRASVKIFDPSITDETIDAVLDEFNSKDVLIEGYKIGDTITVTYVPTKELSWGKNDCRIDILASNYK